MILVGLTMIWYSIAAYVVSCPTRFKKSWMVSNMYALCNGTQGKIPKKYNVYEIQFVYSIYCRILIHSHMHKEFNIWQCYIHTSFSRTIGGIFRFFAFAKGQLISKSLFGVKTSSKKPMNFFPGFLP